MRLATIAEMIRSDHVIVGTDRPTSGEQRHGGQSTPTQSDLRRRYVEHNQTVDQIAAAYGYSEMSMARLMDRYGIPRRPRGYFRPKLSGTAIADIVNRYRAGGTVPRIADELDLHRSVVRRLIDDAGIARQRRPVSETDITDEQLRAEYERGASVMDLVENHDLIRHTVLEALARAGTQMRPPARSTGEPPFTSTADATRITDEGIADEP